MKDKTFGQERSHRKYLKWKTTNPASYARQQLKMRERYRSLRFEAFAKMGNRCCHCGQTDIRVLTLDHVNDDGMQHRASGKGKLTRLYKAVIDGTCEYELQVLCANCHAIKTWNR